MMTDLDIQVKIVAPPERKYSVWIGGSILGKIFFLEMVLSLLIPLCSLFEHIPKLVVLQARVRRVWSRHRSPQYVWPHFAS